MLGFTIPLRAGPAPRMELREKSISEEKSSPEVHFSGDVDSLGMLENYQDD